MIPVLSTAYGWVIVLAAVVTTVVSLLGLLANSYHETLLENTALCALLLAGAVVLLQVQAHGGVLGSGVALFMAAVALYSVAKFIKARCAP